MAGNKADHALERLVFFSDAVFAIAITLLVIEIHVPHLEGPATDRAFLAALVELIPNFVGYLVSFAVIGAFWAGHHRAFGLAARFDARVTVWNFLLLGAIAFMPFVTAFMSAHPGARVPAVLYWSWMVLTAIANLRVCRIATAPPLLADAVDPTIAAAVPRRSQSVLLAAATSLVLAFLVPMAAAIGMATIPLWRRLLAPRREISADPVPAEN